MVVRVISQHGQFEGNAGEDLDHCLTTLAVKAGKGVTWEVNSIGARNA